MFSRSRSGAAGGACWDFGVTASERVTNSAERLARAMLVLDQREAHEAVAVLAEADAWRDRDLGLGEQKLGELERAHRAERIGNRRPHEHRGLGLLHRPSRAIESLDQHVATALVSRVDLGDAQAKGLAEANPATDVEGHDSAHKLCLLVTLAFGALVKPAQIYTEGITRITQADIAYARELGYAIKLLAIGKDDDENENGKIEARVHPTMIPNRHMLAGVGGAFNAIYIHGDALGPTMYSGLGAGEMPSATAVMADILEIARHRMAEGSARTHAFGFPIHLMKAASVKPMDDVVCEYYLRFTARDKPGVLGAIASVLGKHGLSIASVIQKDRGTAREVPVIMRTHDAPERSLKRALAEIRRKKIVQSAPAFIRIEEKL